MTIARVFKTRTRNMNFPTQKFGILTFSNHRLLVPDDEDNQDLIKYIETKMVKDHALGIYMDPNEMTRNLDVYSQSQEIKNSDVQAFLQQQAEVLPESATDQGAVNLMKVTASSSHDVLGKGAPAAHRFSAADVLRAKLAESAAKTPGTPTPIPDSTDASKDPAEVATDATGNPIAEVTDPDALAKLALNK